MMLTVLIPAFKPQYFGDLLLSLRSQSHPPELILVSDDSPGRAFHALLDGELRDLARGLPIDIIDGPRTGASDNLRHLLRTWNGATELAHVLMDDDLVFPSFHERHRLAHASGMFDCTASRRWTALASGLPWQEAPRPPAVAGNLQRIVAIEPDFAFATTVPRCDNWLGELSNIVFHRDVAHYLAGFRLDGISFDGLGDVGLCLAASLRKPLGYLNEPLGCFRMHPAQNTGKTGSHVIKLGHLAWIALAVAGQRAGMLDAGQVAQCSAVIGALIVHHYAGTADMQPFIALLPALSAGEVDATDRFLDLWEPFAGARVFSPLPLAGEGRG